MPMADIVGAVGIMGVGGMKIITFIVANNVVASRPPER